jgi:hypothetical protein
MAQEEVILKLQADIGDLKKELETVNKGVANIGKTAKATEKSAGKLSKGIGGIGLALKAAGIGIALKAFQFLTEALQRNQKIANLLSTAFETISIVFNEVTNVLVGVYENVSKSTENFDALGKVLMGVLTIAITPLKLQFYAIKLAIQQAMLAWEDSFLGGGDEGKIAELRANIEETKNDLKDTAIAAVDAGKDIVTNFVEATGEIGNIGSQVIDGVKKINVKSAYEQAKATTEARNSIALVEAQLRGLVEENDRLAETQRQIRDNENASFDERIAANNKLKEILEKQKKDMLALADQRIAAAEQELKNLDNVENRAALQDAINEKKAIEAQITGFMSEQMTNAVSLENERLEVVNSVNAEMMTARQREIEDVRLHYEEQIKLAKKAGMDTVGLEEQKSEALRKIRASQLQADLDATAGMLSSAAALQKEGTAGWKATKIAETVVSTYSGAQKAYESMVGIPIIGPTLGAIAAGIAVAAGLKQVQTIKNTKIPMATGGMVGGYGSGTSDSVDARLSKGESVINAKSTRMFKPLLSSINQAGGGVGFADGGTLDTGSAGLTTGVVKAYVVADEMTNEQDRLSNIRRKATI